MFPVSSATSRAEPSKAFQLQKRARVHNSIRVSVPCIQFLSVHRFIFIPHLTNTVWRVIYIFIYIFPTMAKGTQQGTRALPIKKRSRQETEDMEDLANLQMMFPKGNFRVHNITSGGQTKRSLQRKYGDKWTSVCTPHGRVASRCKECGGGSICECGRERTKCPKCGGGSLCTHSREKTKCIICNPGLSKKKAKIVKSGGAMKPSKKAKIRKMTKVKSKSKPASAGAPRRAKPKPKPKPKPSPLCPCNNKKEVCQLCIGASPGGEEAQQKLARLNEKRQGAVLRMKLSSAGVITFQRRFGQGGPKSKWTTVCAEHGRTTSSCKVCGGASICECGRERSKCKKCNGGSVCTHGRERSKCTECKGTTKATPRPKKPKADSSPKKRARKPGSSNKVAV